VAAGGFFFGADGRRTLLTRFAQTPVKTLSKQLDVLKSGRDALAFQKSQAEVAKEAEKTRQKELAFQQQQQKIQGDITLARVKSQASTQTFAEKQAIAQQAKDTDQDRKKRMKLTRSGLHLSSASYIPVSSIV
jgi:hypothetical protein